MNKRFTEIAKAYTTACQQVAGAIKESKYKVVVFIDGLKLSRATFYRKMKQADWQPGEMEIISYLLDGKEVPTV